MNTVQLYLTAYCTLRDLFSKLQEEDLCNYISEADPYLYNGNNGKPLICSNPDCYEKFRQYMLKHFKDGFIPKDKSYNAVLNHLREYVGNVYPGVIKAFLTISKEEWTKIYEAGLEKFKDEKEENWQL